MVNFKEDNKSEHQRIVRRLGRIEGVVNEQVTHVSENGAAIDFTIGFPFDPLVSERNRSPMLSGSSISLDGDGMVDTLTFRYPPLKADTWEHGAALNMMNEILDEYDETGLMEVQVNPGTDGGQTDQWYPHILFLHFDTLEPDMVLDFLSESISDYLRDAREETERLREQI